jgi:Tfp pilus assembly protein PilN
VRAVNLIPTEQRRGGGGSGSGVYVVLGVLGFAVIAVVAYVLANNTISERQAQVTQVTAEAEQAERVAAASRPYREFAELSRKRVETVNQLAASRFDWDRALGQLSRVLPRTVWLNSVVGTVAPNVGFSGSSGGDTQQLRQSLAVPAISIKGCTVNQSQVSRVMARLRLIDGVTRVSLGSSEKLEQAGGGTTPAAGGDSADCRNGNARYPQFQVVVFFEGATAVPGAGAAAGGGTVAGSAARGAASTASQAGAASSNAPENGSSGSSSGGNGSSTPASDVR